MLFSYQTLAEKKIDEASGLIIDSHWELVRATCTGCHSAKLIIQNRMNRQRWIETIRWMQKDQGLWSLGDSEVKILDYLSKNYTAKTKRKKPKNLPITKN